MNETLRVLIVEDSRADAELLLLELKRAGYQPVSRRVDTPEAMSEALASQSWDIVLCDYEMPRFSGPSALRMIRGMGIDLPFIIVTGKVGEETTVETMKAGANDYLLKKDLTRLVPAIERELGEAESRRERRLAEAEVLRLASIVESSDDAIVSKTIEGIITSWNKSAEHLYGYTAGEAIGKSLSMIIPPEHGDELATMLERLKKGQHFQQYETVRVAKDGRRIDVSVTVSPIVDKDGKIIGASTITRDITERKKMEEELRKARDELEMRVQERTEELEVTNEELLNEIDERRLIEEEREKLLSEVESQRQLLQLVVENAPVGVALLRGSDFVFEFVNPAYQAIAPGKVLLGRTVAQTWPELASQVLPLLENVFRTGEHYTVEDALMPLQRFPESPLEEVYLTFSYIPLRGSDGQVNAILVIVIEATKQVLAQQRMEELAAEAQRRATELDAANKELEAFSYSVSHDLRAPLRQMDGFGQALLEDYSDKLDEQGKEYLCFVREGATRMAQLIDELLELSRATSAEMHREPVNLSEIATSIMAQLQGVEPEREVLFTAAPDVFADCDPGLMHIVLENLLGNAWKFTSKRENARIEFGTAQEDGKQVYYVRDNGAGFDMGYADRLFVPFQRLHSTEEFPGTGVGLATVQRIIHRHGGRVWAEGEVEKGATFYFTLS